MTVLGWRFYLSSLSLTFSCARRVDIRGTRPGLDESAICLVLPITYIDRHDAPDQDDVRPQGLAESLQVYPID